MQESENENVIWPLYLITTDAYAAALCWIELTLLANRTQMPHVDP